MLDIVFETARFPSSGEDLIRWVAEQLSTHGVEALKICARADGWEMQARHGAATYIIFACAKERNDSASAEWRITASKKRSFIQRTLGTNKMSDTDPLLWMIESALHAETDVANIRREPTNV